jgi:hypothetical protein
MHGAELSWAKVVGVLALPVPHAPARLKEWAYAGFAISLYRRSSATSHSTTAWRRLAIVDHWPPVANDESARRTGKDSTHSTSNFPREH